MVQKTVNAGVKADLKSNIMVWNANFRYSRGHRLSQNTFSKVQTQSLTAKESKPKESKLKETKPANSKSSASPGSNEAVMPNCQEKKKKYQKKKQDQKNSFLAIRDSAIEGSGEKKKGHKKFYDCLKKSHSARNCPEPPKN